MKSFRTLSKRLELQGFRGPEKRSEKEKKGKKTNRLKAFGRVEEAGLIQL